MSVLDLSALRELERAAVWKRGMHAAWLRREPEGLCFEYLPEYRGPWIATSLPTGAEPLRGAGWALPAYFAGLLPEGRRLAALRETCGTDDALTLLLSCGVDLPGDVQVLPEGKEPAEAEAELIERASAAPADVIYRDLWEHALGAELRDLVALPDEQDSVSGRMLTLRRRMPRPGWQLKLGSEERPGLVENEAFFLEAARRSGLRTPDFELLRDAEGRVALLLKRFDRELSAKGKLRPCALEDACQALGLAPTEKGRLSAERVIVGLARFSGAQVVAARALLQQLAFAYLIGNAEAGGKSFAIVQEWDELFVSPCFAVRSAIPYRDPGATRMSLSINGKLDDALQRSDWIECGERCGVPAKAIERVLDGLVSKLSTWIDDLERLPWDEGERMRLREEIEQRAARLKGVH
jgi:serine/threonine-protein kinase HipA